MLYLFRAIVHKMSAKMRKIIKRYTCEKQKTITSYSRDCPTGKGGSECGEDTRCFIFERVTSLWIRRWFESVIETGKK